MSHNYDVMGLGNYENRFLRTKFGRSEYFVCVFLEFAYSDGILNYSNKKPPRKDISITNRVTGFRFKDMSFKRHGLCFQLLPPLLIKF